jgi:tripartite-type tricarboxylate transporter receptor subunit TctC
VSVWYGLVAPRGTPKEIVEKFSATAARVMRSPELAESWAAQGVDPVGSTPAEFRKLLVAEIDK